MGISVWDVEELAYRAMGNTSEETDKQINDGDIDEAIFDKYDCSFETYCQIVEDLIKFTPVFESPLTKTKFHAFVDASEGLAIVKEDIKEDESI